MRIAGQPVFAEVFNIERGWLTIMGSSRGICGITLPEPDEASAKNFFGFEKEICPPHVEHLFSEAKNALMSYFSGKQVEFTFPIDVGRYTQFQKDVWEATRKIHYGELRSYRWIAEQISKPQAARAVGHALGTNPLPVIIPCHRVIRSDGGLGGFSGGLHWKEELIKLEKCGISSS